MDSQFSLVSDVKQIWQKFILTLLQCPCLRVYSAKYGTLILDFKVEKVICLIQFLMISQAKKYRQENQQIREKIDLQEEKIILFWLIGMLPLSPKLNLKLDLRRGFITGDKIDYERFISQISAYESSHFVITASTIKKSDSKYLQRSFDCKIFDNQTIQQAINEISNHYRTSDIKALSHAQFCLIQGNKKYEQYVANFTSSHLQNAYMMKQNSYPQESYDQFYESKVIFPPRVKKAKNPINPQNIASQNSEEDISLNKQRLIAFNKDFPIQMFDKEHFQKWARQENIPRSDFKIKKTNTIVQLILRPLKQNKQKIIDAFQQYLDSTKIVILRQKLSPEGYDTLVDTFCKNSKDYLKCTMIQGYWDPQIEQSRLKGRILNKDINKKIQWANLMRCIWIQGIKFAVQKTSQEIIQAIKALPRQNPQFTLDIERQQLKPFFRSDKIINFFSLIVKQITKDEQKIEFLKVQIIDQKIRIHFIVDFLFFHNEELFETALNSIKKQFLYKIALLELEDENLPDQIKEKQIYLPHPRKPKHIYLLMKADQVRNLPSSIQQFSKLKFQIFAQKVQFQKVFEERVKKLVEEVENKNKVKIQIEEKDHLLILTFFGQKNDSILTIVEKFNKLKQQINNTYFTDQILVSSEESQIISNNFKSLKDSVKEKYNVQLSLPSMTNGTVAALGKEQEVNLFKMPLVMVIKKHYELSSLPFGTSVVFSEKQLDLFKEKYLAAFKDAVAGMNKAKKIDQDRGLELIFIKSSDDLPFAEIQKDYPFQDESKKRFAFIMPEKQKRKFVFSVLRFFQKKISEKSMQIFIYYHSKEDHEKVLNLNNAIKIKKWYVKDDKNIFYEEVANEKIQTAEQNGKDSVYLFQEDLNLKKTTHKFNCKSNKIKHWLFNNENQIVFFPNGTAEVEVKGKKFQIGKKYVSEWQKQKKQSLSDQIDIKLAIYHIDLKKKQQTNIFSDFKRTLYCQAPQNQIQTPLFANYDFSYAHLQIYYKNNEKQYLKNTKNFIKNFIQKSLIEKTIDTKIKLHEKEKIKVLKNLAHRENISLSVKNNQKVTITAFNSRNINAFVKLFPLFERALKNVEYPHIWESQLNDIQTFEVNSTTDEFKEVQKAFKKSTIKKLIRIQNKLVFKKYFYQKQYLKSLNEGKEIEQKMLFHGTKKTNPKIIYEDREESFNINYTSDSNLLGRGTYFATTSEYSHNYRHQSKDPNVMGGEEINEMFYCIVLIGESQKNGCNGDTRDTEYKDKQKRLRYESATTGTGIYTIYKNRRAYPMYLIKY